MDILKLAASQCYQKEANDKVIEHIIEAGHLSILEHCYATFELSCSIQMLLQLTRHRHLSFTVQSSRGSRLTECYKTENDIVDFYTKSHMENYNNLCSPSKEEAAYVLPKAAMYNLIVTGNFRAWYEYLGKRLCLRAQKEHRHVAQMIHVLLQDNIPEIFDRNMLYYQCRRCSNIGCMCSDNGGKEND